MEEYFGYEIEEFGLYLRYPEWWYLRIQDDGSHLFIDEYVGRFSLSPQRHRVGSWEAHLREEAKARPGAQLTTIGGRGWLRYATEGAGEDGQALQHYHYVSGHGDVRLEGRFSHRRALLDDEFTAEGVEAALEEVVLLLGSISFGDED